jgi:hypothetical protein
MKIDISMYKNRQVIINEYMEEELIKRNGLFFEDVLISQSSISFIKSGVTVYELILPNKHLILKDDSFPNSYIIEGEKDRIEVYFP